MKYTLYYLFGLFVFFGMIACNNSNNNNSNEQQVTEPVLTEDSGVTNRDEHSLSEETIAFFNESGFSKYARSKSAGFNWNNFTLTRFWTEDSMQSNAFTGDKNYFDSYGRFLKYSPDSTKFIDLDSYNIDVYKDEKGKWIGNGLGPDTEVSLVDLGKKQRTRLVFLGPGNSIEDAAWLDNNNLVLMGMQENNSDTGTSAVVWKFNLPTKTFSMYELKDPSLAKELKGYSTKERLKGVTIK